MHMTLTEIAVVAALVLNFIAVGTAIYKLGRAVERFESIGTQQAKEISKLEQSVSGMGDLITKIALSNQRLDALHDRMNRTEGRLDELAHGEGFVLPLAGRPAE